MFQLKPVRKGKEGIKAVYPPVSDSIYICRGLLFNRAATVCDRSRFTHCVIESPTWFFPAADVYASAP